MRTTKEVLQLHVFSSGKVRADSFVATWPYILALELKKFRTITERKILDDDPKTHSYLELSGKTRADMLKLETVDKTLRERFMMPSGKDEVEQPQHGVKLAIKWAKPTPKLEMVKELERPKKKGLWPFKKKQEAQDG